MRLPLGGRPMFWATLVIGWAVIAFGVMGALEDEVFTHPASLARWLAAGLVVHDGVWVPVSLAGAAVIGAVVRGSARAPLAWALATGAVLTAIAWPFVRGYGRQPGHPSLLPRNYAAGLVAYLGVVAAIALLWWLAARRGTPMAMAREASDADIADAQRRLEQDTDDPEVATEEVGEPALGLDVPEADALDAAREVPVDDEEPRG